MKYRGNVCPVCLGDDFYAVRRTENITGCYCKKCGHWMKWLSKKETTYFKKADELKIVSTIKVR